MLGVAGAATENDDDESNKTSKQKKDENNFFLVSLAVLGGGILLGSAIGTIVGIIDWISTPKTDYSIPKEIQVQPSP